VIERMTETAVPDVEQSATWSGAGDAAFRDLMNVFPSGVSVVTTRDLDGVPYGLTCTSMCSVSLRPPILLACLQTHSATLAAVLWQGAFAVNLLHSGGQRVAELFATAQSDRFAVSREHHWVWTVPILILLAWQRHSVWRSLVFAATSVVDGPRLPDVAMPPPISGGPDAVREETADALSANTAFVARTLPNSLILAFPAFRRPPAGGNPATPRRQADVASAV
jgi:hypothetical protein